MSDIANKRIVIDLDNTICVTGEGGYEKSVPVPSVVESLRAYKRRGYMITIYSSRNMRTYDGNIGKINANTLPIVISFLERYDIPYDEIVMGKPWAGHGGFYVDDRAIRPSELVNMSEDAINEMLKKEEEYVRNAAT